MKSNTQNTKIKAITETTLVIGIDVNSTKSEPIVGRDILHGATSRIGTSLIPRL